VLQVKALKAAVVAVLNCRATVLVTPPAEADSVAVCAVVTAETAAEKEALVAPAGTRSVAGTTTAALLLDKPTVRPPDGAAAVSVTVQASVPAAV